MLTLMKRVFTKYSVVIYRLAPLKLSLIHISMEEYQTQAKIISGLLKAREERIISKNQVAEVFLSFEPRPRCEYKKYIHQIEKIDNSGGQSQ